MAVHILGKEHYQYQQEVLIFLLITIIIVIYASKYCVYVNSSACGQNYFTKFLYEYAE